MKKTLYYDIIVRKYYEMYNEGFLIVKIDDERLLSIEGIITCDYIQGEMKEDNIFMVYYALDYESQILIEDFSAIIPKENIEIPINLRMKIGGDVIEIITKRKITNNAIKKKYEETLKEFKENSVFQKER